MISIAALTLIGSFLGVLYGGSAAERGVPIHKAILFLFLLGIVVSSLVWDL